MRIELAWLAGHGLIGTFKVWADAWTVSDGGLNGATSVSLPRDTDLTGANCAVA